MKQTIEIMISLAVGIGFLFLGSCAGNSNPQNNNNLQGSSTPGGQIPIEENLLIQAVNQTTGSSATGSRNEFLCSLAREHLQYMNEVQSINHDGFENRSQLIQRHGGTKVGEIVASNSKGSLQEAANSCAQQWRNSPHHWEIMQPYWQNFCYTLVRGTGGTYYCIGLVANGNLR